MAYTFEFMSIFKKIFSKKSLKTDPDFTSLNVDNFIRETEKAVTLQFDRPDGFEFQSGQYLTLRTTIDGQIIQRPYSLCSLPSDDFLRVTVKETPEGHFSKYVNQQTILGDSFDVLPPAGLFTFTPDANKKRHIVAFAGGSGITPIFSIINNLLENEPKSKITLVYGNRIETDIIFKNSLNELAENHKNRFQLIHVLSDVEKNHLSEFTGYITVDVLNKLNADYFSLPEIDCFYLCGPGQMVEVIENELLNNGIEADNVKTELFTAPPVNDKNGLESEQNEDIVEAEVRLQYNGTEKTVSYTDKSKSLLDTALDNDVKVPFSCMNGVCSTCSAKLEEGTVKMNQNFALENEDVEAGYILTCQSHPTSEKISVNWDDNKI